MGGSRGGTLCGGCRRLTSRRGGIVFNNELNGCGCCSVSGIVRTTLRTISRRFWQGSIGLGVTGISVVIPAFGIRPCLGRYVRDVARRALRSVRVVYVGSKSASNSLTVLGDCTRGSSHVGLISGRGNNCNVNVGVNFNLTANRCVNVIRPSSFIPMGVFNSLCSVTSGGSLS